MANRTDFYFRQKVTEAELDLAFDLFEQADHNLASDMGLFGIISGGEPIAHEPVPNLTIDLSGPARGYDRIGQRIYFGSGQNVNCEVDHTGIPTEVGVEGHERWLGVFLRFDRHLSDPRIDGNSQQVFFRRDESFEIIVRQGPSGPEGAAELVQLEEDEILLCDVRRHHGQLRVEAEDIVTSRRQAFVFSRGDSIEVVTRLWNVIRPARAHVQAAMDSIDELLDEHFSAQRHRHQANHIDYEPHGFIQSEQVGEALDEVSDKLSSQAANDSGASLIGAPLSAGNPHSLQVGSLLGQLRSLLTHLNAHLNQAQNAHSATAIGTSAYSYLRNTNIQAQIRELVDELRSEDGSTRIGNMRLNGNPYSLPQGLVRSQLNELLIHLNRHTDSGDHDERYFTKNQSDGRYYTQAQTDDLFYSRQASDQRFARPFSTFRFVLAANRTLYFNTNTRPVWVTAAYRTLDAQNNPAGDLRYQSSSSPISTFLRYRQVPGESPYQIGINNSHNTALWVEYVAYTIDEFLDEDE